MKMTTSIFLFQLLGQITICLLHLSICISYYNEGIIDKKTIQKNKEFHLVKLIKRNNFSFSHATLFYQLIVTLYTRSFPSTNALVESLMMIPSKARKFERSQKQTCVCNNGSICCMWRKKYTPTKYTQIGNFKGAKIFLCGSLVTQDVWAIFGSFFLFFSFLFFLFWQKIEKFNFCIIWIWRFFFRFCDFLWH